MIELCSGGRLEPSMLAITSMSSFSDAHECIEILIIAANLHRAILPQQSQIWQLRKTDNAQGSITLNAFLGECLSGDIHDLNETQWKIVTEIEFMKRLASDQSRVFYRFADGAATAHRVASGFPSLSRQLTSFSSSPFNARNDQGQINSYSRNLSQS